MVTSLIIFICSLMAIWLSAGRIMDSVEHFSHRMRVSPFAFSFFVLGIFTSAPEFIIGINSLLQKRPDIYVGNLLGASLVLFGLVIPLLAITSGQIKFHYNLSQPQLLLTLLYIALPAFLAADQRLMTSDGLLLLVFFPVLWLLIDHNGMVAKKIKTQLNSHSKSSRSLWTNLLISVGILAIASHFLVSQVIHFAEYLSVPAFYISLLVVSVGGNIPELALILKSMNSGNKAVAFGNYLGSAVTNSLILGVLVTLTAKPISLPTSLGSLLIFITTIIMLFYFFLRSQHKISRIEGLALVGVYGLFVLSELINRQ